MTLNELLQDIDMDRTKGIGGSDAGKIMTGEWYPLWKIKTGREVSEDLSHVLPVQIGIATESLNREWFARQMGCDVDQPEFLTSDKHPFMTANLDGIAQTKEGPAVFEAKHVNAFSKSDDVIERYYPQVQHYMAVTGLPLAYLSVFVGTQKWECFSVGADKEYTTRLITREAEFWGYVERDEEPPDKPSEAAPVQIEKLREVDMTGSNEWASFAADWLENAAARKKFESAAKGLKGMVEKDVGLAFGHGVSVNRAKNGALTVRENHGC